MRAWLKRRWVEFRWGHSIYLAFLLSFTNFILISYRFLVEYVGFLKLIFPRLAVYIAVMVLTYVPAATLVGHLHRKRQLKTDIVLQMEHNPIIMEILERVRRIEEKLEAMERG